VQGRGLVHQRPHVHPQVHDLVLAFGLGLGVGPSLSLSVAPVVLRLRARLDVRLRVDSLSPRPDQVSLQADDLEHADEVARARLDRLGHVLVGRSSSRA